MKIIIFLVLVFFTAFFSAAETAYFSLRHSEIHIMRQKKKKNADLVHSLKNEPERLLFTILIGSNLVGFSAASLATVLGIEYFGSVGAGIATGVVTFIVLIFGEIIPKSIAVAYSSKMSLLFAKPTYFFFIIFFPLSWGLLKLHKASSSFLKINKQAIVSEEEIRAMSRLGAEHGVIDLSEQKMIENVFRFDDVKVKDIMTPDYKMEILHGEVPIEQIAHFASGTGFSRFPVDDDGKIIGYIHVNTIMRVLNSDDRDDVVANHISPIKVVSENMPVDDVFRSMQKDRVHLYLVHAEGDKDDIVGLVTMENVLEEIVGEIKDETDDL